MDCVKKVIRRTSSIFYTYGKTSHVFGFMVTSFIILTSCLFAEKIIAYKQLRVNRTQLNSEHSRNLNARDKEINPIGNLSSFDYNASSLIDFQFGFICFVD